MTNPQAHPLNSFPYTLPSLGQRGLALIADFAVAFIICLVVFSFFRDRLLVEVTQDSQVQIVQQEGSGVQTFSMEAEVRNMDTQKVGIFLLVMYWAYFTCAEYFTRGSSLGKRLFRLQVRQASGEAPLPFWRTLLRSLVKTVTLSQFAFLLLLVSVVMAVLIKKRITLHDWMAQSVVIKEARNA